MRKLDTPKRHITISISPALADLIENNSAGFNFSEKIEKMVDELIHFRQLAHDMEGLRNVLDRPSNPAELDDLFNDMPMFQRLAEAKDELGDMQTLKQQVDALVAGIESLQTAFTELDEMRTTCNQLVEAHRVIKDQFDTISSLIKAGADKDRFRAKMIDAFKSDDPDLVLALGAALGLDE